MSLPRGRPAPSHPRLPGWPERLAEAVESARARAFAWGQHDCGLWARSVAVALTGQDPAPWLTGYASEEALAALLDMRGGLEEAVAAAMEEFGAPEIRPVFAQRGDWAVVKVGNETAVGVVLDADRIAVPGAERLRAVPRRHALRAWAV